MATIEIIFHTEPKSKGRPRFGRTRKGAPVAYTDPKTRDYEARLMEVAGDAMVSAGLDPFSGPVELKMRAFHRIPTSWSKAKKAQANWKDTHPDLDNVLKAVLDATNGVVFDDDRQVVKIRCEQRWGETGRIELTVTELEPSDD